MLGEELKICIYKSSKEQDQCINVISCLKEDVYIIFLCVWIFPSRTPPRNLDKRTTITIDDKTFVVEADDLETLCMLGRGAYGIVDKVRHKQSGTIMAVKVWLFYI